MELYRSPTTKELKKKHLPRHVGGAETGSWVESTHSKVAARGLGWVQQQLVDWVVPHSHADKLGGTTGEQDRLSNPGFQHGLIKASKLLTEKTCGVVAAGETPSLTGEFIGETQRVLQCTQTHPPWSQHQKGPS